MKSSTTIEKYFIYQGVQLSRKIKLLALVILNLEFINILVFMFKWIKSSIKYMKLKFEGKPENTKTHADILDSNAL